MDREILKERLLILTDNQIKEILEKYQYLQEIEILPDIIVDKEYFVYNNRRGQYKVKSTLPVSNIMDKMIIGKDIILATHKELILLDRKNPSESKVIFKVNEARTFI